VRPPPARRAVAVGALLALGGTAALVWAQTATPRPPTLLGSPPHPTTVAPLSGTPTVVPTPAPRAERRTKDEILASMKDTTTVHTESERVPGADAASKAAMAQKDRPRGPRMGGRLFAGGKVVQLPPDAYVAFEGTLIVDFGGGPSERDAPYGEIARVMRGTSAATVAVVMGKLLSVEEAPGEQGAFDCLREALT